MPMRFTVPPGMGSISHRGIEYPVDEHHEITVESVDPGIIADFAVFGVVPAPERPVEPTPKDPAVEERAALLARAEAVGLVPDGRWKNDRLRKEVEAAEEAAKKSADTQSGGE